MRLNARQNRDLLFTATRNDQWTVGQSNKNKWDYGKEIFGTLADWKWWTAGVPFSVPLMWKGIIIITITVIIIRLLWPPGINKDFSVSGLFMEYTFFYWFSSQVLIPLLPPHLSFLPVLYHQVKETLRSCVCVCDKRCTFSRKRDESVTHGWRWSVCLRPISSDKPTSWDRVSSITCSVALCHITWCINVWIRVFREDQFRLVYSWFDSQMEGSMMVDGEHSPFTGPY